MGFVEIRDAVCDAGIGRAGILQEEDSSDEESLNPNKKSRRAQGSPGFADLVYGRDLAVAESAPIVIMAIIAVAMRPAMIVTPVAIMAAPRVIRWHINHRRADWPRGRAHHRGRRADHDRWRADWRGNHHGGRMGPATNGDIDRPARVRRGRKKSSHPNHCYC